MNPRKLSTRFILIFEYILAALARLGQDMPTKYTFLVKSVWPNAHIYPWSVIAVSFSKALVYNLIVAQCLIYSMCKKQTSTVSNPVDWSSWMYCIAVIKHWSVLVRCCCFISTVVNTLYYPWHGLFFHSLGSVCLLSSHNLDRNLGCKWKKKIWICSHKPTWLKNALMNNWMHFCHSLSVLNQGSISVSQHFGLNTPRFQDLKGSELVPTYGSLTNTRATLHSVWPSAAPIHRFYSMAESGFFWLRNKLWKK